MSNVQPQFEFINSALSSILQGADPDKMHVPLPFIKLRCILEDSVESAPAAVSVENACRELRSERSNKLTTLLFDFEPRQELRDII